MNQQLIRELIWQYFNPPISNWLLSKGSGLRFIPGRMFCVVVVPPTCEFMINDPKSHSDFYQIVKQAFPTDKFIGVILSTQQDIYAAEGEIGSTCLMEFTNG